MDIETRFTHVIKIGTGIFGDIYQGAINQDAVDFLLWKRSGEVCNALSHPDIGTDIDLVWGKDGKNGFGLAHIIEKHPEIIFNLAAKIKMSVIYERLPDRIILTDNKKTHRCVVDLRFNIIRKKWLVTAYTTT